MTLRNKIILLCLFFYVASLGTLFVVNEKFLQRQGQKRTVGLLKSKAEILSSIVLNSVLVGDEETIKSSLEEFSRANPRESVFLALPERRYYFGAAPAEGPLKREGAKLSAGESILESRPGHSLLVFTKPLLTSYSTHRWGNLVLARESQTRIRFLSLAGRRTNQLLFAFSIGLLLLYALFLGHLFRPLEKIKGAVREMVEKKRLDSSLGLSTQDEFSLLAGAIKRLVFRLKIIEKDLLDKTNSLEETVNKNTADLKAVIGQLEEKTKELSTLKRDFLESERNLFLYTMVSGLAHEINNPLTTILGYLELLIAGKKLPGKALAEGEKLYEKLFAMKESLSRLSELHADEEEGELYEMALWVRSTFGHIKGVTVDSSASSFYAFGHRERLAEAFTEWLSISGKAGAQGWRFSFRQRENENRVLLETTFPSVPDEVEIKKASLNLQLKLSQEGNTEWSFQGKTLTLAFLPSSG